MSLLEKSSPPPIDVVLDGIGHPVSVRSVEEPPELEVAAMKLPVWVPEPS